MLALCDIRPCLLYAPTPRTHPPTTPNLLSLPPSSPSEGASGALTERKLKIVGARAFTAVMRQIHEELLDLIRGAALGTNRLSLYDHVLIPHHATRASHSLSLPLPLTSLLLEDLIKLRECWCLFPSSLNSHLADHNRRPSMVILRQSERAKGGKKRTHTPPHTLMLRKKGFTHFSCDESSQ